MDFRGYLFMGLLAIQFALMPFVTKGFTSDRAIRTTVVLTVEVAKFVVSLVMLALEGGVGQALRTWTWMDSLRFAGLASVIYAVQNNLTQLAYQNLDSLMFNLINQTKILFTALFCYILLGKKQSVVQLFALVVLFVAATILSADSPATGTSGESSLWTGLIPCLAASLASGVAAALSQYALQGRGRNSYLFTMELAVLSTMSLVGYLFVSDDGQRVLKEGFFAHWTPEVAIPIAVNAVGGILVGQVVKHAGSVQKGFAIILGIVLTGLLRSAWFRLPLTTSMLIALPLVIGSMWLHGAYPYREPRTKE